MEYELNVFSSDATKNVMLKADVRAIGMLALSPLTQEHSIT